MGWAKRWFDRLAAKRPIRTYSELDYKAYCANRIMEPQQPPEYWLLTIPADQLWPMEERFQREYPGWIEMLMGPRGAGEKIPRSTCASPEPTVAASANQPGPELKRGTISLEPIYEFVHQHPEIPGPAAKDDTHTAYRHLVATILQGVPAEPGWYCWFQDGEHIRALYIGQASKGSTSSLHARLDKELESERVAFWATVYGTDTAVEAITVKYLEAGLKDYRANQKRSAKKKDATKILWVSLPTVSTGELDVIDNKLIQEFAPPANAATHDYADIETRAYPAVLDACRRALGLA